GLDDVLRLVVPRGWFLPVTPGTKFVTVGGAIANDVHGKNHHCDGTFGRFVTRFELLRSDGLRAECSPTENPDLFAATIGGLGLTGLITWAEFRLRPIETPMIVGETQRYANVTEFFEIAEQASEDYVYTMSWIDCLATGDSLGRGLFMKGNHAPASVARGRERGPKLKVHVRTDFPGFALNSLSMRV
ncbi:MAG: FAD-binding oxidoreductase, partial [Planctomycetales bacterium]|nr:FAD-binding oxidoreductase [Planctomycetales bacterium]